MDIHEIMMPVLKSVLILIACNNVRVDGTARGTQLLGIINSDLTDVPICGGGAYKMSENDSFRSTITTAILR